MVLWTDIKNKLVDKIINAGYKKEKGIEEIFCTMQDSLKPSLKAEQR